MVGTDEVQQIGNDTRIRELMARTSELPDGFIYMLSVVVKEFFPLMLELRLGDWNYNRFIHLSCMFLDKSAPPSS